MANELVQSIKDAEARAASIKDEAAAEAQSIILSAEKSAKELEKTSAEECRSYAETHLKAVEADAQKAYDTEIAQGKRRAEKYAENILNSTDMAGEIVRRIVNGSR